MTKETKPPKNDVPKEKKAGEAKTDEAKIQNPVTEQNQNEMAAVIKEIEDALFAIKFYPVAVDEKRKKEAVAKIESIYAKGNETVRQLLLYMIHEIIATSVDLKIMHTYEFFKMKNPAQDPAQLRIQVYRAMFNYNTSLEGLIEIIKMLGRFRGADDGVKVLTYHFSHLCSMENEASHVMRAAILESLGESESQYALRSLLEYAKYTDSERTFGRIVKALMSWEKKVGGLKISEGEKDEIRNRLKEIITSDFGDTHYG